MADNTGTMNDKTAPNQTIKAEQAKAEFSGHRHDEKAKTDQERQEPSALGGKHPADKRDQEQAKKPESVQPR